MVRLTLDFRAIMHNIGLVDAMVRSHGARWTLATNVLSGDSLALRQLHRFGVASFADTRVSHAAELRGLGSGAEVWFMRLPATGAVEEIVEKTDISLNSQIATLSALNDAAERFGRNHAVVVMVEIGDLSEGVFSGDLVGFFSRARGFTKLDVIGLGANLGSRPGVGPNTHQLNQLAMFRELLELKFGIELPIVSAGTSAVLPLLETGLVPRAINHFRVGESVFLGSDLVSGGFIKGFRTDCAVLEAPVLEVKETTLFYRGSESSIHPFEQFKKREYAPGERGIRAVVGVGQVDTETAGLSPLESEYAVLGAGADHIVVDLGKHGGGVSVGDKLRFRPSYRALMRLMASPYVAKTYLTDGLAEAGAGAAVARVTGGAAN